MQNRDNRGQRGRGGGKVEKYKLQERIDGVFLQSPGRSMYNAIGDESRDGVKQPRRGIADGKHTREGGRGGKTRVVVNNVEIGTRT